MTRKSETCTKAGLLVNSELQMQLKFSNSVHTILLHPPTSFFSNEKKLGTMFCALSQEKYARQSATYMCCELLYM